MGPTGRTEKRHPCRTGRWPRRYRFQERPYPQTCRHCAWVQGGPHRDMCNARAVDLEGKKRHLGCTGHLGRRRHPVCHSRFGWERFRRRMCRKCTATVRKSWVRAVRGSAGGPEHAPFLPNWRHTQPFRGYPSPRLQATNQRHYPCRARSPRLQCILR